MRAVLALLLLLAGARAVWAGAESCEKIKDADKYNACLASFGPVAGPKKLTQAPLADHASRRARRHAAREQAAPPEALFSRKANGRVRMEFLVPSDR